MSSPWFSVPAPLTVALRAADRAEAVAFAASCRAINAMVEGAEPEHREFVAGEVGCVLHLSAGSGTGKLNTALLLCAHPLLLAGLEGGQLGVLHALAVLDEVEHLDPEPAAAVLGAVLGEDPTVVLERTPGQLRTAAKRAILQHDPELAKQRHEKAKRQAGVWGRALPDGMGQVVVECTAIEVAKALAAIDGRAAAMTFEPDADGRDLLIGQRRVAAVLHALGCERTSVQAVLDCPVERAVDLHALAQAPVWTVDVRMPIAVALGLSDHPAILRGYGPIDADQARALLPTADLVKACVDSHTGEVLSVDPPVRAKTWQAAGGTAGTPRARALRTRLVQMATSGGTITDLSSRGYVPSEALGRLVDLRDVTSVFPGDATPARRCDRDHRLPWPLGPTADWNLQNLRKRWHRAKHTGWHTRLLPDGTVRWTAPSGGVYHRPPEPTIDPRWHHPAAARP